MTTPFPESVLAEIKALAPVLAPDFGDIDFVGEPWCWVHDFASSGRERSEIIKESNAPGPCMMDYRDAFVVRWGQDISSKLTACLIRIAELHFSLVAQGLHRKDRLYVNRMKPIVGDARAILDGLFISAVPEEHRRAFTAARQVESTTQISSSARHTALSVMKALPRTSASAAKGPISDTTPKVAENKAVAGDTLENTVETVKPKKKQGSEERHRKARAERALAQAQTVGDRSLSNTLSKQSESGSLSPLPKIGSEVTQDAAPTSQDGSAANKRPRNESTDGRVRGRGRGNPGRGRQQNRGGLQQNRGRGGQHNRGGAQQSRGREDG